MTEYHDGSYPSYKVTLKTLTRAQRKVLAFIKANPGLTHSAIAHGVGCRRYWAIQHLDMLYRNGFARKECPDTKKGEVYYRWYATERTED